MLFALCRSVCVVSADLTYREAVLSQYVVQSNSRTEVVLSGEFLHRLVGAPPTEVLNVSKLFCRHLYTAHRSVARAPDSGGAARAASFLSANEYHSTATTVRVRAFPYRVSDSEDFD